MLVMLFEYVHNGQANFFFCGNQTLLFASLMLFQLSHGVKSVRVCVASQRSRVRFDPHRDKAKFSLARWRHYLQQISLLDFYI